MSIKFPQKKHKNEFNNCNRILPRKATYQTFTQQQNTPSILLAVIKDQQKSEK